MRLEDCCTTCTYCPHIVCLDSDRDAINIHGEPVCELCRELA